jgi:hypothetical protein
MKPRRWLAIGLSLWGLWWGTAALAQAPVESLRLRVVNAPGGAIEASADQGRSWRHLGRVVVPASHVNPASFTAARWAHDSAIAATATNAVHIKVADNPQTGRPMTLSLVPGGRLIGASGRQRSAAIVTDLEGGEGLFGGGLGPYVNSPVLLEREGQPAVPLTATYEPREGDGLLIIRYEPLRLPRTITFENRAGGAIEADYGGPQPERLGVVDRPVTGIGRFEGAVYAEPGRLRANHPGVIDVSTSPYGLIGGFQIIPRNHAESPELSFVKTGTQWLIVGPEDPQGPPWTGQSPLFAECLLPSYRPDDVLGDYADWLARVLSRTQVLARIEGGPWELLPRIAFVPADEPDTAERSQRGRRGLWRLSGLVHPSKPLPAETAQKANYALEGLTHLRLVLPLKQYWPEESSEGGIR